MFVDYTHATSSYTNCIVLLAWLNILIFSFKLKSKFLNDQLKFDNL